MDPIDRRILLTGAGLAGAGVLAKLAAGGTLTPPAGPIAPTGRTLQELYDKVARTNLGLAEPRIPVQSLPGSASAVHQISQPGSYYLTASIPAQAGRNTIEISSDGVALDLGGFELVGAPEALVGILIVGLRHNISISNGVIRDWPGFGIFGDQTRNSVARHLHVLRCSQSTGAHAIYLNAGCIIDRCVGADCNATVFSLAHGGLMYGCVTYSSQIGFKLFNGGTVQSCTSFQNSIVGFDFENDALFLDCNAERCLGHGFVGLARGRFSRCRASGGLDGFRVQDSGNFLDECVATGCAGTGFALQGSGSMIGRCAASQCGTPYSIAPGNSHGPIVNAAGVGDISGVPGANHPWSNFIY